ncbi:MAG TPA: 50S ribosomal protein L11 methyltransferase [Polyangia bacterium]|nr:50S ribosomal protein L11 methyltransferase [Polyangia bacterium]
MSHARYTEIAFVVTPERAEEWIATLMEIGASGVEERDQTTFQKAASASEPMLVVWVPVGEARAFLERAREAGLPPPADASRVRDEDEWRDVWKQYFTPRRVGRFVIVPSWETFVPKPDEIVLDMDPGRAFGTGGHPSTRLCLVAISDFERCERFLDVGCGSGVLSIACAKLFPEASGIAVDVDADAVDVSRENAMRNAVIDRLSISATPVEEVHGPFDVVLANILPDVLVPLAGALAARLADGGTLVLSGILRELADGVEAAYVALGLTTRLRLDEDGWRALVMTR